MIKKVILLILVITLFTGCSSNNSKSLYSLIDTAVNRAVSSDISKLNDNNCRKKYYSYYQSMNVGRVSSDDLSNIFVIDGNTASLSLDVTSIVNDSILTDTNEFSIRDIGSVEDPLYSRLSLFTNRSGDIIPYKVTVSDASDNQYFIMIQTSQFIFISLADKDSCSNTIYEMLMLLRSSEVESKQVIMDYSSDSIKTSGTNIITIFDNVIPESGYLIDYINDWKDDTTFIKIDNVVDNQEDSEDYELNQDEDYGNENNWGYVNETIGEN